MEINQNHMDIANSGLLYIIAGIIVGFVLIQSGMMIYIALKRGKEIGITSKQVWAAVRASGIVSILSSVAISIGFFTLAPILGIPVPWARLSVIGGIAVEISAANLGATAAGAQSFGGDGFTAEVFAAAVWAMTFATMWYLIITPILLKKIKSKLDVNDKKDKKWGEILGNTIMFSMICIFATESFVAGGEELIVLVISSIIMCTLLFLMKRYKKMKVLKDFVLPICMVGSMIFMVLFSL